MSDTLVEVKELTDPPVIPPGETYISKDNMIKIIENIERNYLFLIKKLVVKESPISAEDIVENMERMFLSRVLYDKLLNIEEGATNYKHPPTHSADMITETDTRVWVSPEEKKTYLDKYTKIEIDNKFSELVHSLDWKESVETYDELLTTYPEPEDGWTVNVVNGDKVGTYRWSEKEQAWIMISSNAINLATAERNGLMSKEDYKKLFDLPDRVTLDGLFLHRLTNSQGNTNIELLSALDTSENEGMYFLEETQEYVTIMNNTRDNIIIQSRIGLENSMTNRIGTKGEDGIITWSDWTRVNAGDGLSSKVSQSAHGFGFNAIRLNGETGLYELADTTTGAEAIGLRVDNDTFIATVNGQLEIPEGTTDDKGQPLVNDEFYFLSNTIAGKFQKEKPTDGIYQSLFHTKTNEKGKLVAEIVVSLPFKIGISNFENLLKPYQTRVDENITGDNKNLIEVLNQLIDKSKTSSSYPIFNSFLDYPKMEKYMDVDQEHILDLNTFTKPGMSYVLMSREGVTSDDKIPIKNLPSGIEIYTDVYTLMFFFNEVYIAKDYYKTIYPDSGTGDRIQIIQHIQYESQRYKRFGYSNTIQGDDYTTAEIRWEKWQKDMPVDIEKIEKDIADIKLKFNDYALLSGANFTGPINVDGPIVSTESITSSQNVIGYSDDNLKENKVVINSLLNKISNIKTYNYNFINKENKKEIGVMASEIEKEFPELVYRAVSPLNKDDVVKAVHYDKMSSVAIGAINELVKILIDKGVINVNDLKR